MIAKKRFLPTAEAMEAMGRFNEELRNAGILRDADGLTPSFATEASGSGPHPLTSQRCLVFPARASAALIGTQCPT